MDDEKKRVLICPLGWGLGHASRDIPIIDNFLSKGCEVIVAGDKQQINLLTQRFTGIKAIDFPSFKVKFSKGKSQLWPLTRIAFFLPFYIIKEHFVLKRLIKEHQVDLVISDNRYGLWNRQVKSIFITHQLKLFFPTPFRFFEPVGEKFVRFFVRKFDECWIPDFQGSNNLAGKLSHPKRLPSNAQYIGILSRFRGVEINQTNTNWDLVGVVSGPSPQRELLIEQIEKLARSQRIKTLIIKGLPSEGTSIVEKDGIFYAGHLCDKDFGEVINSTKHLITRSGYTTLMDLTAIGAKGLIVPTPGQTEQVYLAEYLSDKGLFKTCKQSEIGNINISDAKVIYERPNSSNELLSKAIEDLSL